MLVKDAHNKNIGINNADKVLSNTPSNGDIK
jgi:hypothetical protein